MSMTLENPPQAAGLKPVRLGGFVLGFSQNIGCAVFGAFRVQRIRCRRWLLHVLSGDLLGNGITDELVHACTRLDCRQLERLMFVVRNVQQEGLAHVFALCYTYDDNDDKYNIGAVMRKALQQRDGERATFLGTFERMGSKRGWMGDEPTVLLKDIRTPAGEPICNHRWFSLTKAFASLNLTPGDVVQFDARVKEYAKGYKGRRDDGYVPIERDYKLAHPTKVRKVAR